MNKFWAFRQLLDFMADHADIVDADLNYYNGAFRIKGERDGQVITIELTIEDKKEEKKDD